VNRQPGRLVHGDQALVTEKNGQGGGHGVTLLCAANATERKSIDAFLRRVTAQRLTLPGDPAARPLAFRSQESFM
jgi:hypothetical protein